MNITRQCLSVPVAALALITAPLLAQDGYRPPPAPIPQILDASATPLVSVSPDRSMLLLLERPGLPDIAEVSAPEARLAGLRINPRSNAGSRDARYTGLRLIPATPASRAAERRIVLPSGSRIGNVSWSPDSKRIAFTMVGDSVLKLWIAETSAGTARQVSDLALIALPGSPCSWLDQSRLVCNTIPRGRRFAPSQLTTPTGPTIQQSLGRTAANRTYQDLLRNSSDESMFEHYLTGQIVVVSTNGEASPIGAPGIHFESTPSPDGNFILVHTLRRPFSFIVPARAFPGLIEVWDARGQVVKQLADLPLQDDVGTSFDAVEKGPRNPAWRANAAATLVWSEALDDGDPSKAAPKRDRLYTLAAPFTSTPIALLDAETRIGAVRWVRDDLALVDEQWFRTRRTKTWAINPSSPSATPRLVFDRLAEDRYADPGSFAMTAGSFGRNVVLTSRDGRFAFLTGSGASAAGDAPFLDRIELTTGAKKRLWQSAAPNYEEVIAVLGGEANRVLTRRESVKDAPNYFLRDVAKNRLVPLTRFADPAPQFAGVEPQLITYKRADGVQLSAKLYLPAGHDRSKGPLPFLFWAYPAEFKTAAAAAQVIGSPYRFVRPSAASHLFALTQGYGVLDNPTMPIVGEGDKEPNDSYVEQLVASATAAIEKVVALGVADRARIAVGGHSYGAFMTANLLAHSDLFRAGIARSGAYNRTLTPFGFQAEERPFWQARDTYSAMSPFNYADKIKEPILLIHGEADDNSGTFPIQSERMYAALKGNGATVRYVVLPSEAHGYRARESVGHTLWEMINWLDTHVKSASPGNLTRNQ